jgi:fluoride exporter
MVWVAIAVGGGIGAMARHALNGAVTMRLGSGFPAGIFIVNVLGCLAIGLLAGVIAASRVQIGELTRTFLVVGVLGGFTTFSSFGLDTYTLLRGGQTALAMVNGLGQLIAGLCAVWLGFALGAWRIG